MGWAVAINSAGSFISSPIFGYWNDARSTREVMTFSLVIMFIGNVMYVAADHGVDNVSDATNTIIVMAARFVVGFAAGNFAVVQAYLSYATSPETRTRIMGLNSLSGVLGFICGPASASLFPLVKDGAFHLGGKYHLLINDYTLPGIVAAVMSLIGLALVPTIVEVDRAAIEAEEAAAEPTAPKGTTSVNGGGSSAAYTVDEPNPYSSYAALSGLMPPGSGIYYPKRRPSTSSKFSAAATVRNYGAHNINQGVPPAGPPGSPGVAGFGRESSAWEHGGSVGKYNATAAARAQTWGGYRGSGNVETVDRLGDSRSSIDGGSDVEADEDGAAGGGRAPLLPTLLCLFLYFVYMSAFTTFETLGVVYTSSDPKLHWTGNSGTTKNGIFYVVLGVLCVLGLSFLGFLHRLAEDRILMIGTTIMMMMGFVFQISWNHWAHVGLFFLGSAMASVGYSLSTALVLAILSKILEGLDQGFWMGAMSSASSVARLIGPLLCSFLWDLDAARNGRWAFLYNVVMLALACLLIIIFYKDLRPRTAAENRARR